MATASNLGGHRFVSKNAELSRLVSRLLGSDLLEQERRSVVLHAGRSFRYPLEPLDLLRALGVRENVRRVRGLRLAAVRQRLSASPDRTFEEWVVAPLRAPALREILRPLHREAVGHTGCRDFGRLGGATDRADES